MTQRWSNSKISIFLPYLPGKKKRWGSLRLFQPIQAKIGNLAGQDFIDPTKNALEKTRPRRPLKLWCSLPSPRKGPKSWKGPKSSKILETPANPRNKVEIKIAMCQPSNFSSSFCWYPSWKIQQFTHVWIQPFKTTMRPSGQWPSSGSWLDQWNTPGGEKWSAHEARGKVSHASKTCSQLLQKRLNLRFCVTFRSEGKLWHTFLVSKTLFHPRLQLSKKLFCILTTPGSRSCFKHQTSSLSLHLASSIDLVSLPGQIQKTHRRQKSRGDDSGLRSNKGG